MPAPYPIATGEEGRTKLRDAVYAAIADITSSQPELNRGTLGEMQSYVAHILRRPMVREAIVTELKYDRDNDQLRQFFGVCCR